MFRATAVCLSALSKRTKKVKVQLLKDFPMFQLYRGQVVQVKPSFMRNYLHNFNGARYILQDSDIDTLLFQQSQEREVTVKKTIMNAPEVHEAPKATKMEIKSTATQEEKPKGVLEKEITIKDINIPGLDL